MLILFDHGTPAPLILFLEGHTVTKAKDAGWDKLANAVSLVARLFRVPDENQARVEIALGLFAPPHHSYLKATTGLTRVARRAGM
jgi:hypothetical protein